MAVRDRTERQTAGYGVSDRQLIHQPRTEACPEHAGDDDQDRRQRRVSMNNLGDLDRDRHGGRLDRNRGDEFRGKYEFKRPGALISKDALIEAAWSGQAVEEGRLIVRIAALRRVLGEAAGGSRWIETMPRRGYRFIGPVVTEVEKGVMAMAPPVDAARDPASTPPHAGERRQNTAMSCELVGGAAKPQLLRQPDKPSIAVLPFDNMSGDPEQEYCVDGMVEEIITALSRIRWLSVLARNSSFTYKGQAVDVKQVGSELGVRYVLEGSVRKGATGCGSPGS